MTNTKHGAGAVLALLLLGACAAPLPTPPAKAHLDRGDAPTADRGNIPPPVRQSLAVPKPKAAAKTETYSVVVNNVRVQELLFALARDAKLNVDVHPGLGGTVTLNAIDQTLPQLLNRIAKQTDMRWELDGPNLTVMPDTPFLRTYKVDYVNMSRDSSGTVSASSQIATGVASGGSGTSGGSGSSDNGSSSKVDYQVKNHFWQTLTQNIKDILRETDKILPEGSSETIVEQVNQQQTTGTGAAGAVGGGRGAQQAASNLAGSPNPASIQTSGASVTRRVNFREAASVIANPETGVITVRATSRQHDKLQEFLDAVMLSARRQVMIEATIIEVQLKDTYSQGIDWTRLRADGSGFRLNSPPSSGTATPFTFRYFDGRSPLNLALTLNLLQEFGNVKVLSSPKLSVLNNQSAILKVVENSVYFTVKSDVVPSAVAGGQATKAITSTPQSVSVGLVMLVTPQISENDTVTLNVRPSVTSISSFKQDPNPDLDTVPNLVPQIKTREMESVMRVSDGEIAVLGGLMQESADFTTGRMPGVGSIPLIGELFTRRDNIVTKSELVIFLRPVVIREPGLGGDYRAARDYLPDDTFFQPPADMLPLGTVRSPNSGSNP